MGAGAGRRCRRADEDAGDPGRVGVEREARPDQRLPRGVGAGDDVAVDVVRVVLLQLRRRADRAGEDPLAQAGGEAFDLVEQRLAGVAAIAAWHMGVGPDRVDVADRARGIGEVLLADEDEGPLRHPAPVHLALGGDGLRKGADDVDRPGPPRGLFAPGDPALDREVDLEGAGPVLVAPIGAGDPGGQPLTGEVGDGAGRQVEDDRVGRGQLGQGAHRPTGLDRAAVLADHRGEGVGDRLRAAAGDGPAVTMPGADQRHRHRRAERPVERAEGVGGDAAEQRPRRLGVEAACQRRRRRQRRQAEAGQQERVPWRVQNRPHEILAERVEARGGRAEATLPAGPGGTEPGRGLVDRAEDRRPVAAVERVGDVDLGPGPLEAVALEAERGQRRRPDRHRVDRRALVVDEPGHGHFRAAGAAADRRCGLDHGHRDAAAGQRRRAGQAVGAGADDDRVAHPAGATGNGSPPSQGWLPTMSATLTLPSSTRPVAAS